jgi:Domain of unknown function (DUF1929)
MNRSSDLLLGTPLLVCAMISIAAAHSTRESGEKGRTHFEQDWVRINPEKERILYEKIKRDGIGSRPVDPKLDRPPARQPRAANGEPLDTRRDAKGSSIAKRAAVSAGLAIATDRTEHIIGRWDGPVDLNVVSVHTTLMPDGNVLMYDSVGDNPTESYPTHKSTRAIIWNPITKTQTPVDAKTGYNIFCSAHIVLPSGKVFVAGGNLDNFLNGIDKTHTFDFNTKTWTIEGTMARSRWYPTLTMMSNGEALITGGGATLPEIRGTNGILRAMTGADTTIANDRNYNWLKQAPNGKVAYLGPSSGLLMFNPSGTGSWENYISRADNIYRGYGSYAMYDIGKALVTGGGNYNATAGLIDLNTNTAQSTSSMAYQRRQHNLTVLADGTVLATGGMQNTSQGLIDLNNPVYAAEQWTPGTGQWKTLASMRIIRQYHSTAILLPDGRILSSGGGICGDCLTQNYLQKNYEIYSPPYLYVKDGSGWNASRPQLNSVPGAIGYNQSFTIASDNAPDIRRAAMVRFGGVTHGVNMDQQYIPLNYTQTGAKQLTLTSPNNSRIAPPGYYMLFVIDKDGVPARARIMRVQ